MNADQVLAMEELKYRDLIYQAEQQLDLMGMRPVSKIKIYTLAHDGWYATALDETGLVVVITCYAGEFTADIQPYSGTFPNGILQTVKEELWQS